LNAIRVFIPPFLSQFQFKERGSGDYFTGAIRTEGQPHRHVEMWKRGFIALLARVLSSRVGAIAEVLGAAEHYSLAEIFNLSTENLILEKMVE
jgi:hypothetical protein